MNSIFESPEYKQRWAMYEAALQTGLPIVSSETCAIICAMLKVWGNHEMFTHHHRLVCELRYAQKRFHVEGGETPDPEFAKLLQYYVGKLELVQQRENRVPDHIDLLFQERYRFHFNHDKV